LVPPYQQFIKGGQSPKGAELRPEQDYSGFGNEFVLAQNLGRNSSEKTDQLVLKIHQLGPGTSFKTLKITDEKSGLFVCAAARVDIPMASFFHSSSNCGALGTNA